MAMVFIYNYCYILRYLLLLYLLLQISVREYVKVDRCLLISRISLLIFIFIT